jgi:hypothetical protein
LAERDRDAGRLSGGQESFIYESIAELVEETHDEFVMSAGNTAPAPEANGQPVEAEKSEEELEAVQPRRILCLAEEDEADRIAAVMFAQLLTARGYHAEASDAIGASEEVLRRLEADSIEGVVISAIAPNGTVRLRAICRKLRRRTPGVKILIGLWNAPNRLERLMPSLRKAGADALTATFKEGFDIVHETLPPQSSPTANEATLVRSPDERGALAP